MTYLQPSYSTVPSYDVTLGPEVADLCAEAGFDPDAGQRDILDAAFAVDGNRPAMFEVGVVAPRQNIKTGVQKQIALGLTFLLERPLVIWSAHEAKTSHEAYLDLEALIEKSPFLARRTLKMNGAEGREYIQTRTGRILFRSRTKSGGRGLSGDDTILDEAFALQPSHMGALLPVMLTRPHAQVFYGSSSGLRESGVLRALRNRGRAGSERLAYFEWSDPQAHSGCEQIDCDHHLGIVGCALDDRARWWATNPALGLRIDEEGIASLRRSMPPDEFAREVLGWWDDPVGAQDDLTPETWQAAEDRDAKPLDPLRVAVDAAPDLSSAAVVVCGRDAGGALVVEVLRHGKGVRWLEDMLPPMLRKHRITKPVAILARSPIASRKEDLEHAGIKLDVVPPAEYARACQSFVVGIVEGGTKHRGEGALTAAALGAMRHSTDDGFRFSRKNSGIDISPLIAAALARHLLAGKRAPKTDAELLGSAY
ncbi:MAG: hypothetical protein ACRCSL_02180 [Microbacterium sp.]